MARIALINSPIRVREPPKHIPYGLAILAHRADLLGHEVVLVDCNAHREYMRDSIREELKKENKDRPYSLIGITGLVTTYGFQKEMVPWLRRDFPGALLVAGGGCASSIPSEMMRWIPELDMVCVGEGENTFLDILDHLEDREFGGVQGIMYREDIPRLPPPTTARKRKHEAKVKKMVEDRSLGKQGSAVRETPLRPLLTEDELNKLPYPAWHLLDMEEVYFPNSPLNLSLAAQLARRRIDVISERGCPMQCTFCFHGRMGGDTIPGKDRLKPMVRWQSAKYVVDMIKYARLKMAIDFVSFLDENFLANKKRAFEICDRLEKEDLVGVVQWGVLGHANTADLELFARLRECGCTYISYGFESADQGMLDAMKKMQKVEQTQRALDLTLKAKLNPLATYMVGMPGETVESLYNTTRFWVRNDILCGPFFVTPYPSTALFEENRRLILDQVIAVNQKEMEEDILRWFRDHGSPTDLPSPQLIDEVRDDRAYETFVLSLGDATKFTVNLTSFTDPELLGLRDLMVSHDLRRLRLFALTKGITLPEDMEGEVRDVPDFKEGPMGEAQSP